MKILYNKLNITDKEHLKDNYFNRFKPILVWHKKLKSTIIFVHDASSQSYIRGVLARKQVHKSRKYTD